MRAWQRSPRPGENGDLRGELTFNPLKNIAVYQGDVVVIDAQMDLLCDKLTIHFADKDKAPKTGCTAAQ